MKTHDPIRPLVVSLKKAGLSPSFRDYDVLEFEIDISAPDVWPSRYAILGLKIRYGKTKKRVYVDYSIEPMAKPEKGDACSVLWKNSHEKRVTRKKAIAFLKTELRMPIIMAGRGWFIGTEIETIFETKPHKGWPYNIHPGDEVTWNDPDGGLCSRTDKVVAILYGEDTATITWPDGTVTEVYLSELA